MAMKYEDKEGILKRFPVNKADTVYRKLDKANIKYVDAYTWSTI